MRTAHLERCEGTPVQWLRLGVTAQRLVHTTESVSQCGERKPLRGCALWRARSRTLQQWQCLGIASLSSCGEALLLREQPAAKSLRSAHDRMAIAHAHVSCRGQQGQMCHLHRIRASAPYAPCGRQGSVLARLAAAHPGPLMTNVSSSRAALIAAAANAGMRRSMFSRESATKYKKQVPGIFPPP